VKGPRTAVGEAKDILIIVSYHPAIEVGWKLEIKLRLQVIRIKQGLINYDALSLQAEAGDLKGAVRKLSFCFFSFSIMQPVH
jgi:hypothetical protein